MHKRRRETVAFDVALLEQWHTFCAERGYVRRQAAHACRIAFMMLTPQQREEFMEHAVSKEGRNGVRSAPPKPQRSKRAARAR